MMRGDLRRLGCLYRRLTERLDLADEALFAIVEGVSCWSIAGQLHHIALVNQAVLRMLDRLLAGEGQRGGQPTWLGRAMLVSGWVPRGKGRAPDPVVPPANIERQDLEELLVATGKRFAELRSRLSELACCQGRLPHFVFGRLSARQWIRFGAIHTWHHLKIIIDIERQLADPK